MSAELFTLLTGASAPSADDAAGFASQQDREREAHPLRFRGKPHLKIDNGPARARLRQRLQLIQLAGRSYPSQTGRG